jgi:5'-nucleotidase
VTPADTPSQTSGTAGPRILCTNDDGIHAHGLDLLARVARGLGRVRVVAPDRQQSASSHSLTLHRPLRLTETGGDTYVVDGTPTDCVLLAVSQLYDDVPDLVLSGVNHGPNMGEDVLYSGTVAAAMEATILGIPAVAISFTGHDEHRAEEYEEVLRRLLSGLLARREFPAETFFNVNLPDRPASDITGVRITSLGRRTYLDSLTRSKDPRGREYFWIGGGESRWRGREDSDFRAVQAGYVSVTPLHLDLTDFRLIEEVRGWPLGL